MIALYSEEQMESMMPAQRALARLANEMEHGLNSLKLVVDELGDLGPHGLRDRDEAFAEGIRIGEAGAADRIIELIQASGRVAE